MDDYCGAFPPASPGSSWCPPATWPVVSTRLPPGRQALALGALCVCPYGMPLDHPTLEPYWKAAAEYDLGVVLHTFTVMPPYAPGGLDTWDNLWLQRSAAHPWCGMRNMAALIGSGVMDRYPQLRIDAGGGHSWLPFWMARLDEHAHSIASAAAAPAHTQRLRS